MPFFRVIDLSILNWSIILMAYSIVPIFSYVILLWGVTSFEPKDLPCLRCILDSFVNCLIGISIHVGVFATWICDIVTFFVLMNASSNWFVRFCKWMIIWTFILHWFVWGSRWDIVDAFQVIFRHSLGINFFFLNDEKTLSLKW